MAGRDDVDHQPLDDMDLVIRADRRVCYLSLSKLENSAFDYSSIGHCGRAERLDGLSDWICSGVLKPLVCRLRPTHEPSIDPIRLVHGYVGGLYGFCSSHAANTMSVAFLSGLLLRNKYITPFLVLYVVLNCYSRMYLGVHYPSDIIAGLLVGALMAAGCYWALRRVLPADGEVARQGGS